jgi:S1 RNA binding domain/Zc3h12a-like Ribonuclease NYN domain
MASNHVVVDGSNIATEGRAAPSLQQLDEAVRALLAEYGYEHVTVVVDATFGHRIDAKEVSAYEEAVLNGELVTPPAGAIGRGDAFVLQIADRANANVFSNDSFQEFHGDYPWLFDEGRLIGGKPVANVGWVFVLRAPVRGPASRRSLRDARKSTKAKSTPITPLKTPTGKATQAAKASHVGKVAPTTQAAKASHVGKVTPTTQAAKATKATKKETPSPAKAAKKASLSVAPPSDEPISAAPRPRRRRSGGRREPINDQLVYLTFVVDHPLGTVVEGTVDRFSSHGAYVHTGDAQCYVPLRELGDPPPRSAREVLNLGETRPFVVHRFDPVRRGIDVLPVIGSVAVSESGSDVAEAVADATGSTNQTTHAEEAHVSPAAKKAGPRRRAAAKKAPARKKKATAKRAPARKKAAARKTTARKSTARKSTARKRTAKKATRKKAPARKKAAAKRTTARKSTKKATRKRAPARKRAVKRTARKR